MSPQVFRTRITDLFGIVHPILGGGMMWLSDARYVAAMVNAGAMAFITPRSFATLEEFRGQLELCMELTNGKPFGVNLTLSARVQNNELIGQYLRMALDAGVRFFETAGADPGDLIEAIHQHGGIVIHKASRIRHAQKALQLGADAVTLVGMEAGGHPGLNELPMSVMGAYARERITAPFALGGGIGSGRQIVSALALGADAVVIGTRFLVCHEIWAHDDYKRHLLKCDEEASTTALRQLGDTWRVLDNDTAREVKRLEAEGVRDYRVFGDLVRGAYTKQHCYANGDWQKGMASLGPSVGFANRMQPVAAVVDELIADAVKSLERLQGLSGAARQVTNDNRMSQ
jgi:nitronate monooxygenase